jgi:hypothetical protein
LPPFFWEAMFRKSQNGIFIDMGPGHSGQFSGDFHKSGKYRYLTNNKKWHKKKFPLPFIQKISLKLDQRKYPILYKYFNKDNK